jgi:hypothetical protein
LTEFIATLQDAEERQPQNTELKSQLNKHGPLLREIPPGGKAAPIQGLDWFRKSLLEDADGDYATDFLEEPQMEPSDDRDPAAKKFHLAALQSHKGKASPARVSRLTLERGNVTTSEEIPSFKSINGTGNKRSR